MRHAAMIVTLVAGTVVAGAAAAAEAERYRLEKSETGYVRMDTQTGEMSICEERSGQLVCRVAADERSAFQTDVDLLEAKVKALENRVAALENSLAARYSTGSPSASLPSRYPRIASRSCFGASSRHTVSQIRSSASVYATRGTGSPGRHASAGPAISSRRRRYSSSFAPGWSSARCTLALPSSSAVTGAYS